MLLGLGPRIELTSGSSAKITFNPFIPMSDLGSSDSPQVKLTHEWAQTFKTKDIDLIAKTLHKDYRQITYPRSLGRPEDNPFNSP